MAGRPKAMARKVEELAQRAALLHLDLLKLAPPQHLQHVPTDETGQLWWISEYELMKATVALADLVDQLRARVGLPPLPKTWEPTPETPPG